ncbi:MAG: diguanylate cyclase [Planctomycetes bacterium]|nr:diguanylate cyclase [Planctomycetota bacterium]
MNIEISRQKILIVDDVPLNIKILGQALRCDYEIVIASSGKEALNIAASENAPDIILLDIIMPKMDGYEICKKLKEDLRTQHIPIIFISSKAEVEEETKGLELGAVDYITKPFCIPIVKARVKTHLNLKKKSDMLEKLACIDGLTNIENRRRFDEFIRQEWHRARRAKIPLSLIFSDVDFFKSFNDNYGHTAGDECLLRVAQTLKNSLCRATDFLARYGGEEFVAVLPEVNSEHAVIIAEKMRENIQLLNIPHSFSGTSDRVTISLGVATAVPNENLSLEDLIKVADSALYEAKSLGRNKVVQGFIYYRKG